MFFRRKRALKPDEVTALVSSQHLKPKQIDVKTSTCYPDPYHEDITSLLENVYSGLFFFII